MPKPENCEDHQSGSLEGRAILNALSVSIGGGALALVERTLEPGPIIGLCWRSLETLSPRTRET
jgi:hypothetical protein